MSHTKSGQKALKELAERDWHMQSAKDRQRLTFLTDEMLAGHREDILLHEDTYDPHVAKPTVENNFWTGKGCREVPFDPAQWTIVGTGVVDEGSLAINLEEEWN